jgi:hypothetical protein
MLYIDVQPDHVRCFLDHSESSADRWTFAEVLAGHHDAYVRNLFDDATLHELKAEVQRRLT